MTMLKRYRRGLLALLAIVVVGAFAVPAASAGQGEGPRTNTYRVTIENLTGGQPFTPPVVTTHSASAHVFRAGAPASPGVQDVAENGGVPTLVAELEAAGPRVGGVTVAESGAEPPLLPGEEVTFEIDARRPHRELSWVSMLICTNDGFAGSDALRLPARPGRTTVAYAQAYDAGTEINTEDFDDLVPPCGPLTGVDSGGAGTGMTNPGLAEGGVVHRHLGVQGIDDLVPEVHDWDGPVARIEVTRVR